MAIRDILVHLEDSAAAESRLDLAILYARRHNANLRGVYAIGHAYYEPREIGELTSLQRTEAMFRVKTAAAGVASEWIFLDSSVTGVSVTELLTLQAYYSDLVVVGQTNHRLPSLKIPKDLPESLVKICGRPVLVVPYAGSYGTAGDRVVVAWKAGRESVRSLGDAMPHLKKSNHVFVVGVSSDITDYEPEDVFGNIRKYLGQHEVSVRSEEVCNGNRPIGDIILNLACERTADLLVMGACAPTRRGTLEISPVAQHVLKHLTVPVLLSH